MSISIEDILLNHGLGASGSIRIVKGETEPTGVIKEGTIWFRASDSQLKIYMNGGFRSMGATRGVSLAPLVGSTTISTVTNTTTVPVTGYSPTHDMLFVTQNGTQLTETVDYSLNKTTKAIQKLSGNWSAGTVLTFIVITLSNGRPDESLMTEVYEHRTTVTGGLNNITFALSMFNANTDYLRVLKNGKELFKGYDWALNPNHTSIDVTAPTTQGDTFHFFLHKKMRDVLPSGGADGSLITNGSITAQKLAFGVVQRVNDQLPNVSGNVSVNAGNIGTSDTGSYFTTTTVEGNLQELGRAQEEFKVVRLQKDAHGLFVRVELRDKINNKLFCASVMSGGTAPNYTTRTLTYYEPDGTTVKKTVVFTLSYDGDGDIVSEV